MASPSAEQKTKSVKAAPAQELSDIVTVNLWQYETTEREAGRLLVAGVDEAGRGPLAGPVVAAAVILPIEYDLAGITIARH